MFRIGVDLGGTKIAAAVLRPDGSVAWEQRVATPRHDYDATLRAIHTLVAAAEAAVGERCSVGVGTPGAISPATGRIKNANSTWLNGRFLRQDLERALGREVRLANDANCLAVSEATDGAAAEAGVVFAVILGTGCGGGLVVHGRLIAGANAVAGEWGHNGLPWPDAEEQDPPACYCGLRGCNEVYLSGPGIAADYVRRGGDGRTSEVILGRAAAGEPRAAASVDAWLRRLAKALACVINLVDPEVIVIGGGLSRVAAIYEEVPRRWSTWVFSDEVVTRLVPAQHGDASGVRGAARLWDRPGS